MQLIFQCMFIAGFVGMGIGVTSAILFVKDRDFLVMSIMFFAILGFLAGHLGAALLITIIQMFKLAFL